MSLKISYSEVFFWSTPFMTNMTNLFPIFIKPVNAEIIPHIDIIANAFDFNDLSKSANSGVDIDYLLDLEDLA